MCKTTRVCFVSNLKQTASKLKVLILVALCAARIHGQIQVSGDIRPATIEIDPKDKANLVPDAAGFVDWIKDYAPNTDPQNLEDSIAAGIKANETGATGGKGHWYGVRIVDGIATADQDIFISGGKENILSTWEVGANSVGSPKYDITQAYLANNATTLFFGMERRGNDGTTAFDFEFNIKRPDPASPYKPTRTKDDVLFTFEMQGSGKSGTATPYYFIWDGNTYVKQNDPPPSLKSSINNDDIEAGPWGYVNSKGEWVLGNLPRFEFAEASVLLTEAFKNFLPCGARYFVQVRTRSSSTDSSDLKDTTKIFEYVFPPPTAVATYDTTCKAEFTFDSKGSKNSKGGTDGLTYSWSFLPLDGVTLSGVGIPDANGVYHSTLASGKFNVIFPADPIASTLQEARIRSSLTVTESASCDDSTTPVDVLVRRPLVVSAFKGAPKVSHPNYSILLNSRSNGGASWQWQRRLSSNDNWNDILGATGPSLEYSDFDVFRPLLLPKNFPLDGDNYVGNYLQVQVRVRAFRTASNKEICVAESDPVTLRKLIAIDP